MSAARAEDQVPARALRVPPRGRRRRRSGGGSAERGRSRSTRSSDRAAGRGDRPGHELDPAPGARAARSRARSARSSRATWCITRLGQGVDRTGRLDPAALERTVDGARPVLPARAGAARRADPGRGHARRPRRVEPGGVRCARFASHAGPSLEVIDGEREAALSFLGGTRGSIPTTARSSWSTSAAARPSSSSGDSRPSPTARSRRRWGASG